MATVWGFHLYGQHTPETAVLLVEVMVVVVVIRGY